MLVASILAKKNGGKLQQNKLNTSNVRTFWRENYQPKPDENFSNKTVTNDVNKPFKKRGLLTINAGERYFIQRRNGTTQFVDGPARTIMFGSTAQKLKLYTVDPSSFLRVIKKDGTKEYLYGPSSLWENPLEHVDVSLMEGMTINAQEAIIVYRESKGKVTRRVVRGPALHMPQENEWLHNFSWHGASNTDPELKVPGSLNFKKLRILPDQLYFTVTNVRTKDDALLQIKLMIFFQLNDIEKMLDQTHDPIADFINGVSADVIDRTSPLKFEDFKLQSEALNDINTYKQLQHRANLIGYNVSKVVFRGYVATDALQKMHHQAIETRTKLVLEKETEQQTQDLADFKLAKQMQRNIQQQQMRESEEIHKQKMLQINHEETLRQAYAAHNMKLKTQQELDEHNLEIKKKNYQEEIKQFQAMKELQVDLTKYLVAKETKIDRLIKFENGVDSNTNVNSTPQFHLHQTDSMTN